MKVFLTLIYLQKSGKCAVLLFGNYYSVSKKTFIYQKFYIEKFFGFFNWILKNRRDEKG